MATKPFQKGGMFDGANHIIFERAKQLRNTMSDAETLLWNYLRNGVKGLKFRRQHPLGIFIADFYCHKLKLIVELDGSIHNLSGIQEHDEERQHDLEQSGFIVIRFTNKQVAHNLDNVLKQIEYTVEKMVESNLLTKNLESPL